MIRQGDWSKCEHSCSLQILRDIVLPNVKRLENLEQLKQYEKLKNDRRFKLWFIDMDFHRVLEKTIAATNELSNEYTRKTGIDIKCSIELTTIVSLESLAWMALLMIGDEYVVNEVHILWMNLLYI